MINSIDLYKHHKTVIHSKLFDRFYIVEPILKLSDSVLKCIGHIATSIPDGSGIPKSHLGISRNFPSHKEFILDSHIAGDPDILSETFLYCNRKRGRECDTSNLGFIVDKDWSYGIGFRTFYTVRHLHRAMPTMNNSSKIFPPYHSFGSNCAESLIIFNWDAIRSDLGPRFLSTKDFQTLHVPEEIGINKHFKMTPYVKRALQFEKILFELYNDAYVDQFNGSMYTHSTLPADLQDQFAKKMRKCVYNAVLRSYLDNGGMCIPDFFKLNKSVSVEYHKRRFPSMREASINDIEHPYYGACNYLTHEKDNFY